MKETESETSTNVGKNPSKGNTMARQDQDSPGTNNWHWKILPVGKGWIKEHHWDIDDSSIKAEIKHQIHWNKLPHQTEF